MEKKIDISATVHDFYDMNKEPLAKQAALGV